MKFYRQEIVNSAGDLNGCVFGTTKKDLEARAIERKSTLHGQAYEFNVAMNHWDWMCWLNAWASYTS